MRVYIYILLMVILTGCATPFSPVTISRDMSHCKSPGCIIYEMWEAELEGEIKGTKLKALEGFVPPLPLSLSDANEWLHLDPMHPLGTVALSMVAGGPIIGLTSYKLGEYGSLSSCYIMYMDTAWDYPLVHEVAHCLGYKDRGLDAIQFLFDRYTEKQRECMEVEQKESFVETKCYEELQGEYLLHKGEWYGR